MLRDPTTSRSQRLIVTLLGDRQRTAPIASSALVRVMREFEISAEAVRTALSRLVKRDLLLREKVGRETYYQVTAAGLEQVIEGERRILDFGEDRNWDNKWTLVAFSVSERQRNKRHALRAQLRAFGYAPLFDGLWISAFGTPADARQVLLDSDIANAIVFRGELPDGQDLATVMGAWDVVGLDQEYAAFIERFTPFRDRLQNDAVSPAEALIGVTKLMDDWRVFPRIDPELPVELMSDKWPRAKARALFLECRERAMPMADLRYASLLQAGD